MFWPTGASAGSSIRPLLSSDSFSSLAEHIMPCDSTPRSWPTLISNGLPSAPGGSTAPAMAQIAFMPARTFGAPQTMFSRVPVPTSTWQTFRRSAFGCLATSSTSATTTFENGGATGLHFFDFEAGHRQQVGQFIRSHLRIDHGTEPVFGKLHNLSLQPRKIIIS